MLILTRNIGETIMVGDDVEITILEVNGRKVKVGCSAPAEVSLHRREIWEKIQRENEEGNK